MVTTESVELHYEGYSITAEVTLVDGVGHELSEVYVMTDSTDAIYSHPSVLTKQATRALFTAAERQHDRYLTADPE